MRRGIYNLLGWLALILGGLLAAAGVLFLILNLFTLVLPLPYITYPQAFVLAIIGVLVLVTWRLVFGRVP